MVKSDCFLSKIRNKRSFYPLTFIFNIILKVLAKVISKKKNKKHGNLKEIKPIFTSRDYMILYIENHK